MAMLVALAGACFFSSPPAGAGGSPFVFERSIADGEWYEPGEVAVARAGFGPGCCSSGWIEDGPYSVEISRYDESGNAVGERFAVGQLRIGARADEANLSNWHEAVVEFVVPDVEYGTYVLNHCNEPCTKRLGDITAGWFRIGPPPIEPEPVEAPPTPSAVPSTTVATTTPTTTTPEPSTTTATSGGDPSPSRTSVPLIAGGVGLAAVGGTAAMLMRRGNK